MLTLPEVVMCLKSYFQQGSSYKKKNQTNKKTYTCRELRVFPSPFGGIRVSLQVFRGHSTTLTSVVHAVDFYREIHHSDGRWLWKKAKQLPPRLQT